MCTCAQRIHFCGQNTSISISLMIWGFVFFSYSGVFGVKVVKGYHGWEIVRLELLAWVKEEIALLVLR